MTSGSLTARDGKIIEGAFYMDHPVGVMEISGSCRVVHGTPRQDGPGSNSFVWGVLWPFALATPFGEFWVGAMVECACNAPGRITLGQEAGCTGFTDQ